MTAAANSNLKRVSLELGGKSPLIILPDANLDLAAQYATEGAVSNQGQNCCAASRTFAHVDIYDELVAKCQAMHLNRIVGDPYDEITQQGPQVDHSQFDRVMSYIEKGKKEGATLLAGGERHGTVGFFVKPTLFGDVEDHMTIAREEIFGPVQSVLKFSSIDEVIKRANNTTYGLAAAVFTKDINNAMKLSQGLQAGSVWVNCYDMVCPQAPFGGFKMSGVGRELGPHALEHYTEVKNVTIALSEKNS